jgi:hypothetical protein
MICKPCGEGGDLLQKLRTWPKPETIKEATEAIMSDMITDRVKTLHDQCTGCDCQHKITEKAVAA